MPNRWIGYIQQNIPGNIHAELGVYSSLNEAANAFVDFCEGAGNNDCSMTLYFAGNDQSMYDLAKEFEDIGCPFDYPDRLIDRGSRGGVKISRC